MFEENLKEPWIETVVFPCRLLILYNILHYQMPKVDSSIMSNGKSNDPNRSGNAMESTDFGSEDVTDHREEQMPFFRHMVLVYHSWNHVVLVKGPLQPQKESEKLLVGQIFNKVVHRESKSSIKI